jgi:hypothetical protein
LLPGDKVLLASGEESTIESVDTEALEKSLTVYNFEVADWHTYFVGESAVLVHNSCAADPSKMYNADQQALNALGKELKNGVSEEEANILVQWAEELGVNTHPIKVHPERSGIWSYTEHIKLFNMHIPVIK